MNKQINGCKIKYQTIFKDQTNLLGLARCIHKNKVCEPKLAAERNDD